MLTGFRVSRVRKSVVKENLPEEGSFHMGALAASPWIGIEEVVVQDGMECRRDQSYSENVPKTDERESFR